MRKRWAERAESRSSGLGLIEVGSGDEEAPSQFSLHGLALGMSDGGSQIGSPSRNSFLDSDDEKAASDGILSSGRFSEAFFEQRQPEGSEFSFVDDSKRRKTFIQVVDDSTDVPLPAEDVVSSNRATRQFSDLALRATNVKQFKFPWEKGRLGRVFGDNAWMDIKAPSLEPTGFNPVSVNLHVSDKAEMTPKIKLKEVAEDGAAFKAVVRKVSEISYVDERKFKRTRAIRMWWSLLATAADASEIGRKAQAEASTEELDSYAHEILDACFGLKSPGTLLKRYYSLKSFHDWCIEFRTSAWLPMTETLAWEYVRWLKSTSAPPTKATSFMEACRFCWFVVGVDGSNLVESSFRIKGASNQMKAAKRPWRPADLLTVHEVLKLHEVLESEQRHIVDRVFCGHLLHLLYGRARWSDLLATKHLHIDSDNCYLEVQTQLHKGAKAADTKSRLLPVVSPGLGVAKTNWATTYLKLREQCGLSPPMETEWHMLPAPLDDSGESWSTRYLTSEEGSEFLRLILGQPKSAIRRLSTHSLKSTAISWTSKFGLGLETRAILARHATSLSNPTVLYSRDIISAALREFDKVLADIRDSCFQPDRTRSGMITPRLAAAATPSGLFTQALNSSGGSHLMEAAPATPGFEMVSEAREQVEGQSVAVVSRPDVAGSPPLEEGHDETPKAVEMSDSETSEEASEESSSSDEETHDVPSPSPQQELSSLLLPSKYYINEKSSVIHCLRTDDVFRCGKKRTIYYANIRELNGMRCGKCFNL